MSSENTDTPPNKAYHLTGDDEQDRVYTALTHLESVLQTDGDTHWKEDPTSQKTVITAWAEDLGLLLSADEISPHLRRGGQEHDIFEDEPSQRIIKVTRNGVFGLTPGIELELVSSGNDPRRLHLWDATPYHYLQRLHLQNLRFPGLNNFEGIIIHNGELSMVISQPRFDIIAVSEDEIDAWFDSIGFKKIASASYYREEDNLGIFDAHDKNVLRSHLDHSILIPFDVIPCHPSPNFLNFIQSAIAENIQLHTERSTHTSDR